MTLRWRRLRSRMLAYWFRKASPVDLAVCRIAVIAFELFMLCVPFAVLTIPPVMMLELHTNLPDVQFEPLPILRLFTLPFGMDYRPTMVELQWIYRIAQCSAVFALIGLFTRTSVAIFIWARVILIGHMFSYGEFHHIETVSTIFLLMLPFSPCGHALSVDAWIRRRRERKAGLAVPAVLEERDRGVAWPLLTMRVVFAIVYSSAALSKLFGSGGDWLNGFTLQRYILQGTAYWGSDLGMVLGMSFPAMLALGYVTLLFEGTFFLVLWKPWLAWFYLPLGIAFHTGIWLTIRAPFLVWVVSYVVFVRWNAVFRRLLSRRGDARRHASPGTRP